MPVVKLATRNKMSELFAAFKTVVAHTVVPPPPQPLVPDIEALHTTACASKAATYIDPATGYTVFTARAHSERGYCCGSQCRHCPFGNFRVTAAPRKSRLSGTTILRRRARRVSANDSDRFAAAVAFDGSMQSCLTLSRLLHRPVAGDRPAGEDGVPGERVSPGPEVLLVVLYDRDGYSIRWLHEADSAGRTAIGSGPVSHLSCDPIPLNAAMSFALDQGVDMLAIEMPSPGTASGAVSEVCTATRTAVERFEAVRSIVSDALQRPVHVVIDDSHGEAASGLDDSRLSTAAGAGAMASLPLHVGPLPAAEAT
jgi:hypothetical protein